jgi:hypothetical protein
VRDTVRRQGVKHVSLEDAFALGERSGALTVTPLRSAPRSSTSNGPNATSASSAAFPIPLRLQWGSFIALLPGDATPAQLRALLAADDDLRATVLILPERLLRAPETARLIAAADPELILTQGEPSTDPPPDTDLPTAWHRTSLDGPAHLRVYPDGTYRLVR